MDISLLRAMHPHRDYIIQFAFGPHPFVAISSVMTAASVSVWDVDTWTERCRIPVVDRRRVCLTATTLAIASPSDVTTVVWQTGSVQRRAHLVLAQCFCQETSCYGVITHAISDTATTVQVVDLASYAVVHTSLLPGAHNEYDTRHAPLLIRYQDQLVTCYNIWDATRLAAYHVPDSRFRIAALRTSLAIVYDHADRAVVYRLTDHAYRACPIDIELFDCTLHPRAPIVCIADFEARVVLWNYESDEVMELSGFGSHICVAFNLTGTTLWIGDDRGRVWVYGVAL